MRRLAAIFAVYRAQVPDEWRLLRLRFEPLLFVLGRTFPFVGNGACGGRRNSGLPRRSPRLRTFVQNPFSLPFHLTLGPQSIPNHKKLKAEGRLQINAPVRRRLRKGLAGESIRKAEK